MRGIVLLTIGLFFFNIAVFGQSQTLGFEGQSFGTQQWSEDGINWTLGSWANIRSYYAHSGSNSAYLLSGDYLSADNKLDVASLWLYVDDMSGYNTYVEFKGYDVNGNLVKSYKYYDMGNMWEQVNLSGFNSIDKLAVTFDDASGMGEVMVALDDIGFNNVGALPVELETFSAKTVNGRVTLRWKAASEVNNYGFEVERKAVNSATAAGGVTNASGKGFEKIGFVDGSGNSNSPKDYSFSDAPSGQSAYQYRLKQIDNDGSFKYSKTIEVSLNSPSRFNLEQNYPNPFNPSTNIQFTLPVDAKVVLEVYNTIGQKVATLINREMSSGNHSVVFNAEDLPSGIYIYRLHATSGNKDYLQIKKLLLLK